MSKFNKKYSVNFSRIFDPQNRKYQALAVPEQPYSGPLDQENCQFCSKKTCTVCPKCLNIPICSNCWRNNKQKKSEHLNYRCFKNLFLELRQVGDTYRYFAIMALLPGIRILPHDYPVILPLLPDGIQDKDKLSHMSICLGCHDHFYPKLDRSEVCAGCGADMCSRCLQNYVNPLYFHSKVECDILRMFFGKDFSKVASCPRTYIEFYLDLCVLRVLLSFAHADTNAFVTERYRIFTLLATTPRFKKFTKTTCDDYDGIQYMKLNKALDRLVISLQYTNFDREVVQQVYKTMVAFWEVRDTPPSRSRFLFLHRHFMGSSHCSANVACVDSWPPKLKGGIPDQSWVLYTTKEIFITSEKTLVALFFDFSPSRFMCQPLRIEYLASRGIAPYCGGPDSCNYCTDPTEAFTYTVSIRCLQCSKGLYAEAGLRGEGSDSEKPRPPLWTSEYVNQIDWRCTQCEDVVPFSLILEVNKNFREMYVEEVLKRVGASMLEDIPKFVESSLRFLHPFNSVILQAKWDFVRAARDKHLWESGFHPTMMKTDLYRTEKNHLGVLLDEIKNQDLRLLPTWNKNEISFVRKRQDFAADCLTFLEQVRNKVQGKETFDKYPEYIFLKVEYALLKLATVSSAHYYHSGSAEENLDSVMKVAEIRKECAQVIRDFDYRRIQLTELRKTKTFISPYLCWPDGMACMADLLDNEAHTGSDILVDLIMKDRMAISSLSVIQKFRNAVQKNNSNSEPKRTDDSHCEVENKENIETEDMHRHPDLPTTYVNIESEFNEGS